MKGLLFAALGAIGGALIAAWYFGVRPPEPPAQVTILARPPAPPPQPAPLVQPAPPTTVQPPASVEPAPPAVVPAPEVVRLPVPAPELKEVIATTTVPEPAARGLAIPVAGVLARQLSDNFSQRRGKELHEALDIMAPRGTPVVAVEDGKIAKLFTSKPGGLTIYQFDPTEKFAYYYAHLDAYAQGIAEGRAVKRGEVIGYVGSTGNANPSGPHLHFAIFALGPEKRWWKGTAVNPYPLLTAR